MNEQLPLEMDFRTSSISVLFLSTESLARLGLIKPCGAIVAIRYRGQERRSNDAGLCPVPLMYALRARGKVGGEEDLGHGVSVDTLLAPPSRHRSIVFRCWSRC
jgi:hypothetical protein